DEFRQSVDPAGLRPVRSAGVDDAGSRVDDQRGRLPRRRVRQAEKGNVGRIQQPRAFHRILAPLRIDLEDFDVLAAAQELIDLQACRAFLAIHENLVRHLLVTLNYHRPTSTRMSAPSIFTAYVRIGIVTGAHNASPVRMSNWPWCSGHSMQ